MKAGRDASAARGAVFGRWAKDFGLGEREMMLRGEMAAKEKELRAEMTAKQVNHIAGTVILRFPLRCIF